MFLLLLVVTAILVAVFVMISSIEQPSQAPMTDIQAPDNSAGKAVPRLYGKARLNGNNIYYGGLSSYPIVVG